jgi:hypothetical protein
MQGPMATPEMAPAQVDHMWATSRAVETAAVTTRGGAARRATCGPFAEAMVASAGTVNIRAPAPTERAGRQRQRPEIANPAEHATWRRTPPRLTPEGLLWIGRAAAPVVPPDP